jgi:DNA polymerase-3 subunit chi
MTEIDFYTHCRDPLAVAARICGKAFAQKRRVRVLTADAAMTESLDQLLWRTPATGFVPHCRLGSRLAGETPVLVDHALDHQGPAEVLVNLGPEPPPFFGRFDRLAEIVGAHEAELAQGRERYRFYRERGYALRNHRMDNGETA